MKVRFLLDENLSKSIKEAVKVRNPEIDILCVGDLDAPPLGTIDPDVLHYVEQSQRILITKNRKSMPLHLHDRWSEGGHIWGLFWVRPKTSSGQLVQELILIWEASEAQEYIDRVDWIPF